MLCGKSTETDAHKARSHDSLPYKALERKSTQWLLKYRIDYMGALIYLLQRL